MWLHAPFILSFGAVPSHLHLAEVSLPCGVSVDCLPMLLAQIVSVVSSRAGRGWLKPMCRKRRERPTARRLPLSPPTAECLWLQPRPRPSAPCLEASGMNVAPSVTSTRSYNVSPTRCRHSNGSRYPPPFFRTENTSGLIQSALNVHVCTSVLTTKATQVCSDGSTR